ncbi:multiple epidermal growth factor-like domains protein 6 [Physella acuta]|uniref:multiple epidermal growth factor-like domains protein 6 n=1 Tax=Physella acuta TaxID=109671 RepID=UPI0027DC5DD0|nr:multiple epidermal growth factor-like domains protein 6 [Physella acuta]
MPRSLKQMNSTSFFPMCIGNERCCHQRLQGFSLQTVSSDNSTVFSFRDTEPEPQLVYTVTGSPHKAGAVWIQPRSAPRRILTLCEVQVFGDSLCAAGYYGLDCQQHCNCAGPASTCFIATGSCMDGCRPGYQGEDCSQACRPGRWGKDCAQICSSACAEQSCDHVTGVCDRGCVGALPPLCATECEQGYYGTNCTLECPPHCKDGACNMSSGSCPHCEPGYTGDFCTQVCPDKMFGPACLHRCSDHCQTDTLGRLEVCHHVTGTCILGCHDGYEGFNCTKATETHPLTSVFIGVSVSVGGSVSTVFNTSWPIG